MLPATCSGPLVRADQSQASANERASRAEPVLHCHRLTAGPFDDVIVRRKGRIGLKNFT